MTKYEKLGLFLVRLLCAWLALLAIKAGVDFVMMLFAARTTPAAAIWLALLRIGLLLLAAWGLNDNARRIAAYLGRDLED